MTAPRLARANRSRFFIGLGILILTMGFVAIFHNSQQQLDELRHMEIRCEQQQEALSSQVSIAENSLRLERSNHQLTKEELKKITKDEKEHREKYLLDSNLKYTSLQQHYKLLKSQHEDLAESCATKDKEQLEQINSLQRNKKDLISQNAQQIKDKDRKIEHLKIKIEDLEKEKHLLVQSQNVAENRADSQIVAVLKDTNEKLEKQLQQYKMHCAWTPPTNDETQIKSNQDAQQTPVAAPAASAADVVDKNFNAQIPIFPNVLNDHFEHKNILEAPAIASNQFDKKSTTSGGGDKTSKGNDQKLPNAPLPLPLSSSKMRTSSTTETNVGLKAPEQNLNANNLPKQQQQQRQIPAGVVPVPDTVNYILNKIDETIDQNANTNPNNNNNNNRYSNVVQDIQAKKDTNDRLDNANLNEIENGAREVNDNNDFVVDERSHKDHMREALDDVKFGGGGGVGGGGVGGGVGANNAAEEDTNVYDKHFNLIKSDDAGAGETGNNNINNMKMGQKVEKNINSNLNNNNKLKNEIDGDQGKVAAAYPDDMQEQIEDEDEDEYSNPLARNQDQVVRN